MSRTLDARRSLAALTALVVAVVGATALPAAADPGNGGNGNGHSQSDKAKKAHKAKPAHAPKDKSDKAPKAPKAPKEPKAPKAPKEPKAPKPPQGGGHGSQGGGHGSQGGGHNPGGNNGTIKIDGLEFDTAPNNEPHPGCRFQVDFYGFDEGDLYADVTFEAHSPTTRSSGSNVLLTDSVFIGEDDASGGGSEAGLDAQVEYTLDFTGITPHPKQGYHVKLTIHADGSKGADTKHKVFWVQPCAAGDTPGGDTPGGGTPGGGTPGGGTPGGGTPGGDTPGGDTPGGDTPGDTEVLGEQASSGGSSDTEVMGAQASAGQDVPTAVDAGEEGNFVQDVVRSPIPLLIIGLGALLATIAVVSRRRNSSI